MSEFRRRCLALLLLALAVIAPIVVAQVIAAVETAPAPQAEPARRSLGEGGAAGEKYLDALGMRYWLVVKAEPRPLRIHHVRVDLANPRVEIAAACADDPDAEGPANAKLTPPMILAERARAVAFVNANPWQSLPDKDGKRATDWTEGLPVEVLGMVASQGKFRGEPVARCCGFWVDRAGKPHVGNPPDAREVREGVAGFLRLLDAGKNLHVVKPDEKCQPRTALGLDATARFLTLVVVDGRQQSYSMGMTYFELAEYMKGLGCSDAVNLDGGGSSVMILSDPAGARRIVNDPSTKDGDKSVARPIPVGLAIRAKP